MSMKSGQLLLLFTAAMISFGCSSSEKPVASGTGPGSKPTVVLPSGPLKLEVDAALTQEGITVIEKSREPMKLVLTFGATKRDHDSSNYSRVFFDADGKQISKTGISVPRFAKDSTFDVPVDDDDLPKASRIVIQPLGK